MNNCPIYYIIGRHNIGASAQATQTGSTLTPEFLRQDHYFIKDFTYWFLTKAKYPYDFTTEQYILREMDHHDHSGEKFIELDKLIADYCQQQFLCRRNPVGNQSAPGLIHYHIGKFHNLDTTILKWKNDSMENISHNDEE